MCMLPTTTAQSEREYSLVRGEKLVVSHTGHSRSLRTSSWESLIKFFDYYIDISIVEYWKKRLHQLAQKEHYCDL